MPNRATPRRASDPGLALLAHAFDALAPEPAWTVSQARGFTWWGRRLAQRLWAEEPRAEAGRERCRVHAVTDVLRNVPDSDATRESLNTANRIASLSAVVWDRQRQTISLRCSVEAERGNLAWLTPLFGWAAALQVSAAHVRARDMAEIFDATVDTSDHPASGRRESEAGVLTTVWRLGLGSTGPSPWGRSELARAVRAAPRGAPAGAVDELHAQVSCPFAGIPAGKPGSATLIVAGDAEHVALGRGALVRLKLPVLPGGDAGERAAWLNASEDEAWTGIHHLGAWRRDPTNALTFCTFLPRMTYAPGLLAEMVQNGVSRAAWADRMLAEAVPSHR